MFSIILTSLAQHLPSVWLPPTVALWLAGSFLGLCGPFPTLIVVLWALIRDISLQHPTAPPRPKRFLPSYLDAVWMAGPVLKFWAFCYWIGLENDRRSSWIYLTSFRSVNCAFSVFYLLSLRWRINERTQHNWRLHLRKGSERDISATITYCPHSRISFHSRANHYESHYRWSLLDAQSCVNFLGKHGDKIPQVLQHELMNCPLPWLRG